MKQRLLKLGLLLAAGAIINVAVAWGCSWLSLPQYAESTATTAPDFWPSRLIELPQSPSVCASSHWKGFGIDESDLHYFQFEGFANAPGFDPPYWPRLTSTELVRQLNDIYAENNPLSDRVNGIEIRQELQEIRDPSSKALELYVRVGWPVRSLHGWAPGSRAAFATMGSTYQFVPEGRAFAAIRAIGSYRLVRGLPYGPLWPGFAINTILYAAIVGVLCMFVPLKLRRWWRARRIKRGLCPACAYPVGTNPRCTECGKPVVTRSVEGEQVT